MIVELITVPGTATRSTEAYLWKKYVSKRIFSTTNHNPVQIGVTEDQINVSHLTEDNFIRLTEMEKRKLKVKSLILSTWLDPLRVAITNHFKAAHKVDDKEIIKFYERMRDLILIRPVLFIDLRFIPITAGVTSPPRDLTRAYNAKNMAPIIEEMPNVVKDLRSFDWGTLPVEDWWR